MHAPVPQTLAPPPPHVWEPEHDPQFSVPPHPSGMVPQLAPFAEQVVGVHEPVLQAPPVQGSPLAHVLPQVPQLVGSEPGVVQMPAHRVPGQVSVSPEACILYSTSRLASAPVFAAQLEPVRSDACSVAPAAKVRTMGPVSDQYCPGVRTRSWPFVPSVKRNTAAGQVEPVGVFAVAAMRNTVIAWSRTNWPPSQEPLRVPGKKDGKIMREFASVPAAPAGPCGPIGPCGP